MKKKGPESVLRREDLNADIERFLKSGKKIEKIATGVSAQVAFGAAKPSSQRNAGKKPVDTSGTVAQK